MIEYQDELRRLNSELRTAKQDYDNAADFDNEVDMEIAENYVEKLEWNIDVIKKAEAFDRLRESYDYFSGRKLKDVHGLGMDAYGIVGKYKTDSGEE